MPTRRNDGLGPLCVELDFRRESASALRVAGQKLEAAVDAWRGAGAPGDGPLRKEASRCLWVLLVQREAMGLSRHEEVYHAYAIPPSLVPQPG